MSVSSTTCGNCEEAPAVVPALLRVEQAEDGSGPGCGWPSCCFTSWTPSLGVSGVRTLGSVVPAPDRWAAGLGKGLLVEGERDSSGLLGVAPRDDSGELGPPRAVS